MCHSETLSRLFVKCFRIIYPFSFPNNLVLTMHFLKKPKSILSAHSSDNMFTNMFFKTSISHRYLGSVANSSAVHFNIKLIVIFTYTVISCFFL